MPFAVQLPCSIDPFDPPEIYPPADPLTRSIEGWFSHPALSDWKLTVSGLVSGL